MRIGLLLAGCGYYDGTDVQEMVLTLLALESVGEKPVLLAPDFDQVRCVDHLDGSAVEETRGVLRESARMARAAVRSLSEYRPDHLEALIIPGGYGPVVNLSLGFAEVGRGRSVTPDVEVYLRHFLEKRKPIGLISLGEVPVRTILGEEIEIAPPPPDPGRLRIDREHRIVHTPGFTAFNRLTDVLTGIEAMVGVVLALMKERSLEAASSRAREGGA